MVVSVRREDGARKPFLGSNGPRGPYGPAGRGGPLGGLAGAEAPAILGGAALRAG
jgi:hypothetical protein